MNKRTNLIIWIIAGIILISSIFILYTKYNPLNSTNSTSEKSFADISNVKKYKIPVTVQFPEKSVIAPEFNLLDLNGNYVNLAQFKGKKVILNFWATWCKYCVEEMPDFQLLKDVVKIDYNAVIVPIDVQENKETVSKFLTDNHLNLENVLLDVSGETADKYGISGFPSTFILNEDGTIHAVISGLTNKEAILAILYKMQQKNK